MKSSRLLFCASLCSLAIWGAQAQSTIVLSPGAPIADAIRQCEGKTGSTTIYLRGGVYHLQEPLQITPAYSNGNHSLTICSYPGEKAVISGGSVLRTKWRTYKGRVMMSKIEGTDGIDMLFGDGRLLTMARFPNYDSTAVRFHGTSADATSPDRVKGWKNPEGGFLHAMHREDWGDFHYRIIGKDGEGHLKLEGGHQNNRPMGIHQDNRMVENIFEELDAPRGMVFRQGLRDAVLLSHAWRKPRQDGVRDSLAEEPCDPQGKQGESGQERDPRGARLPACRQDLYGRI